MTNLKMFLYTFYYAKFHDVQTGVGETVLCTHDVNCFHLVFSPPCQNNSPLHRMPLVRGHTNTNTHTHARTHARTHTRTYTCFVMQIEMTSWILLSPLFSPVRVTFLFAINTQTRHRTATGIYRPTTSNPTYWLE